MIWTKSRTTDTFATMSTKKSFSLISHDSTVLESRSTLPDRGGWMSWPEIERDEPTRIDQLLRVDWVAMGFKDLLLESSYGFFAVCVDLGACSTSPLDWSGRAYLEDLLLQCLYRYLHYGPEQSLQQPCVTSCVIIVIVIMSRHTNRVSRGID